MTKLKQFTFKLQQRWLKPNEYCKQVTPKDLLVIHFTAGYGNGVQTGDWFDMQPGAIATAYSTSKDGTLVELFGPAYWAYHLGSSLKNEMRSVGNEVCCIGPLWLRADGKLYDAYGKVYTGKYVKLPTPFRGVSYFAEFTEEQYIAVAEWAAKMCIGFNIPPIIERNYEYVENNDKLKGIATHTNFRKDKWDMSPAWDWDKFEAYFKEALEKFKK